MSNHPPVTEKLFNETVNGLPTRTELENVHKSIDGLAKKNQISELKNQIAELRDELNLKTAAENKRLKEILDQVHNRLDNSEQRFEFYITSEEFMEKIKEVT
jgi:hypothetical protein